MDKEELKARIKFLFSEEMLQSAKEAEYAATCKTCGRVILCGKILCDINPCELKERHESFNRS